MTADIHIERLVARADRRDILSVSGLEIATGELVGLLGPNGAGKSTLLRCLLGMQEHVRGRVAVLGHDVGRLDWSALAALRRRIGYVPQVLPARGEMPLTVREVVAIGRTGIAGLLRPLRREDWRIVDEWIERLGLSDLGGRGFGEISGGEQRKTLIARAMVQRPDLLILDEPTANLDLHWREQIVEIVGELHGATRLTVVLVCHELEVVPPACGRVVVLDAGRVMTVGRPVDVLSDQLVGSLYGAGLAVLRSAGRWAVVPTSPARPAAGVIHA